MTIESLLKDKSVKPKEKVETISQWLLQGHLTVEELIAFAAKANDAEKGTCIEATEFATRIKVDIANESLFDFVTQTLKDKAPRVKWESAKVIGNTAKLFPSKLQEAISNLIENTTSDGTVIRWSSAFALGEILKLNTAHNEFLISKLKQICELEEKNSIKKIYLTALKKAK